MLAVLILRGTMVYDANSTLFNAQAVGAKVGMSDLKSVMTPKLMKNHQQFVEVGAVASSAGSRDV